MDENSAVEASTISPTIVDTAVDTAVVDTEDFHQQQQDEIRIQSTSMPVRGAASEDDTGDASATEVVTPPTDSESIDDSNDSSKQHEMPMIYRLMPIKLLAVLLILSLIVAIRHMVDFHSYEGIDPSSDHTKHVEFELLQLAEDGDV
ncbi:MAG: hypothetical protein SGARI_004752 [Bacillariaceae sp.]